MKWWEDHLKQRQAEMARIRERRLREGPVKLNWRERLALALLLLAVGLLSLTAVFLLIRMLWILVS